MPLEHFEALAAIEAEDAIRKHGFFTETEGSTVAGSEDACSTVASA